jgi:hypothetical protein
MRVRRVKEFTLSLSLKTTLCNYLSARACYFVYRAQGVDCLPSWRASGQLLIPCCLMVAGDWIAGGARCLPASRYGVAPANRKENHSHLEVLRAGWWRASACHRSHRAGLPRLGRARGRSDRRPVRVSPDRRNASSGRPVRLTGLPWSFVWSPTVAGGEHRLVIDGPCLERLVVFAWSPSPAGRYRVTAGLPGAPRLVADRLPWSALPWCDSSWLPRHHRLPVAGQIGQVSVRVCPRGRRKGC